MSKPKIAEIYTAQFNLPIGELYLCATINGIAALYFITKQTSVADIEAKIKHKFNQPKFLKDDQITAPLIEDIKNIWGNKNNIPANIKLDLHGTDFQKSVWKVLLSIQSGKTLQYNEVAEKAGRPKAIRAAASAIANNPVSILVPCHRVLPKSGGVGNYAGGSDIKEKLLRYEQAI